VAAGLYNLATLKYQIADYQAAVALYEESLSISRETLGNRHRDVADCLNALATIHSVLKDFGAAHQMQQESPMWTAPTSSCGRKHPPPSVRSWSAVSTTKWRRPLEELASADATEAAVGRALQGRELVHLATHGFFATGRCRSALEGDGGGFDPMLLSGLALAGANQAPIHSQPKTGSSPPQRWPRSTCPAHDWSCSPHARPDSAVVRPQDWAGFVASGTDY